MIAGMPLPLPVSMIIEITLGILLAATVFVCARLEFRLKRLRSDQTELAGMIATLNTAINGAEKSLFGLRQASKEAGENLGRQIGTARNLTDELSLLFAAGERIASRIEAGRMASAAQPRRPIPSAAEALRAVR